MSDRSRPFVPNPVLGGLIGAGPLVAAARSFSDGLVLGVGAALSALALEATLPALKREIPERFRAPASIALSASLAIVYGLAIEAYLPVVETGLWIYLPLLAVNGLSLHAIRMSSAQGESGIAGRGRFGTIFREALGYLLVACFMGAFREACGLGTLTLPGFGSVAIRMVIADRPPLRLLAAPAGGFIALGLLTALYRGALRARGRRIP
jgi:Na+-translocating ferredoxin:NAD+ oxidoreductase RnfE subunit